MLARTARFSAAVSIIPWIVAAVATIGVTAALRDGSAAQQMAHDLFLTAFSWTPACVLIIVLVGCVVRERRSAFPSQTSPLAVGSAVAATAWLATSIIGAVGGGEYGFGLAATWSMLSGHALLSFGVGAHLWRRWAPTNATAVVENEP